MATHGIPHDPTDHRRTIGLGSLLSVCLLGLLAAGEALAAFLPLDHWAYRDLDALQVRGYQVVPAATLKPYTRAQIARGVARIAADSTEKTPYERQMIGRLMAEFAPDLEPDADRQGTVSRRDWWVMADVNPRVVVQKNPLRLDQPRPYRLPAAEPVPKDRLRSINTLDLAFRVAPGLTTGQRLEMDSDGRADNNYRGGDQSYTFGYTAQVDEAYVLYEMRWGSVAFGRIPLRWGPGRQGNLMLSENAPAVDMLLVNANVRWLHVAAFTGQLDSRAPTLDTEIRRYLAGRRLSLTPFSWLEVGLAEAMLYGGPDQSLSLAWSNPVNFFYSEEVNSYGAQNNGTAAFDIALRPLRGVETYGEFLIDDWSFDNQSPDRYALTVGGRWERPFGWDRFGLGAEYTRLTRWLYNNANLTPYLRFTHRQAVLGHHLGPDGDALFLTGSWESPPWFVPDRGFLLTGLLTHRRQGETRFTSRYPVDYPGTNFGYSSEPFPFGVVETTTTAELLIATPPVHGLIVTVAFQGQTVRNPDNQRAPRRWDVGFRLDLDWHIPVRW